MKIYTPIKALRFTALSLSTTHAILNNNLIVPASFVLFDRQYNPKCNGYKIFQIYFLANMQLIIVRFHTLFCKTG